LIEPDSLIRTAFFLRGSVLFFYIQVDICVTIEATGRQH